MSSSVQRRELGAVAVDVGDGPLKAIGVNGGAEGADRTFDICARGSGSFALDVEDIYQ